MSFLAFWHVGGSEFDNLEFRLNLNSKLHKYASWLLIKIGQVSSYINCKVINDRQCTFHLWHVYSRRKKIADSKKKKSSTTLNPASCPVITIKLCCQIQYQTRCYQKCIYIELVTCSSKYRKLGLNHCFVQIYSENALNCFKHVSVPENSKSSNIFSRNPSQLHLMKSSDPVID